MWFASQSLIAFLKKIFVAKGDEVAPSVNPILWFKARYRRLNENS